MKGVGGGGRIVTIYCILELTCTTRPLGLSWDTCTYDIHNTVLWFRLSIDKWKPTTSELLDLITLNNSCPSYSVTCMQWFWHFLSGGKNIIAVLNYSRTVIHVHVHACLYAWYMYRETYWLTVHLWFQLSIEYAVKPIELDTHVDIRFTYECKSTCR